MNIVPPPRRRLPPNNTELLTGQDGRMGRIWTTHAAQFPPLQGAQDERLVLENATESLGEL